MEQICIHFNLNGQDVSVMADPNKRLVDFLREDMGLTSVKEGCGEGEHRQQDPGQKQFPAHRCAAVRHQQQSSIPSPKRLVI